jgi:hypothetical protein
MDTPGEATTRRDRYELVPGMTAYRATRIFRRITALLTLVWVALGVGVGLLLGAHGRNALTTSDFVLLAVVAVGPMVVILALVGMVARRDRAEAAAGYTTQTSGRVAFDQVDPVTGVVIRRAHSAVLTLPAGDASAQPRAEALRADAALAPTSARDARTYFPVPPNEGRAARIVYVVAAAIFTAIMAAILLPLALIQPDASERDGLLIALVVVVLAVVLLVAITLGIGAVVARGRIRRIAATRPGETVFLSPQTPELRQALKARDGSAPHLGLGGRFVVSVGIDAIRLWKGRSLEEPRVTLPWDRVDHVQAGTLLVAAGRTTVRYRTAHVFLKGDPSIDVPLPIAGSRGQGAARASAANEVLAAMARYAPVRAPQQ